MITIRFRGQQFNGDWVEGYYFYDGIHERHFILTQDFTGNIRETLVKPDSVGRFTGRQDKNSKDIFEGDIVKNEFFVDTVVRFGEQTIADNEMYSGNDVIGFYLETRDGTFMHLDHKKYPLEVIGNIYRNKGLPK